MRRVAISPVLDGFIRGREAFPFETNDWAWFDFVPLPVQVLSDSSDFLKNAFGHLTSGMTALSYLGDFLHPPEGRLNVYPGHPNVPLQGAELVLHEALYRRYGIPPYTDYVGLECSNAPDDLAFVEAMLLLAYVSDTVATVVWPASNIYLRVDDEWIIVCTPPEQRDTVVAYFSGPQNVAAGGWAFEENPRSVQQHLSAGQKP